MLNVSDAWKAAFPGAVAGVMLVEGLVNPQSHAGLDAAKAQLEADLRAELGPLDRATIRTLPPFSAYRAYFDRFGKTYHVQLQVESIALKGRSIPHVAALVEAMFMSELKNRLLTAGHDADSLRYPIRLDVASGEETYVVMNGQQQALKPGDMYMCDGEGVISSVVLGPDQRTRIQPDTTRALFAVYSPAGVGRQAVEDHLKDIAANVRVVAPLAEIVNLEVESAELS